MTDTNRPATALEWDQAWAVDATATYFQSRAWSEAMDRTTDGRMRPQPAMLHADDGSQLLVPVTVDRRAGGAIALARYVAGRHLGWTVARYGWPVQRGGEGGGTSPQKHPLGRLALGRLGPYGPASGTIGPHVGGSSDKPARDLKAGWRGSHDSSVKKAVRAGVRIDVASGLDDWRAYFAAYEDSLRRWGARTSSTYPWALFEALASSSDQRVRLWLARLDGAVVAGALCLDGRQVVSYWHGAAVSNQLAVRPVNLLLETAILDAMERGFAGFDLGPSGGHQGVEAFKRTFAPDPVAFSVVARESAVVAALRNARSVVRARRTGSPISPATSDLHGTMADGGA